MNILNPDVVYIGPQRTGSTYLRSFFSAHPDIEWIRTRRFFSTSNSEELNWQKTPGKISIIMHEGLAMGYMWPSYPYEPNLLTPAMIKGNEFYSDPVEITRKIKCFCPHAKIIITLRNQVDWIRSNYLFHAHYVKGDLRKYFQTLSGKSVLLAGNFHILLREYFELFGRENVLVMFTEKLDTQILCDFLRIKPVSFMGKHNKSKKPLFYILTKRDKEFIRSFYAMSNHLTEKLLGQKLPEKWRTCEV